MFIFQLFSCQLTPKHLVHLEFFWIRWLFFLTKITKQSRRRKLHFVCYSVPEWVKGADLTSRVSGLYSTQILPLVDFRPGWTHQGRTSLNHFKLEFSSQCWRLIFYFRCSEAKNVFQSRCEDNLLWQSNTVVKTTSFLSLFKTMINSCVLKHLTEQQWSNFIKKGKCTPNKFSLSADQRQ